VDPLNELSRAIGTLEGIVTTLAETVTRQNESAEASREEVRQTIQGLGEGLTSLRRDVELLSGAVATMTPTVKRVADGEEGITLATLRKLSAYFTPPAVSSDG